jgi:hypothetical protein
VSQISTSSRLPRFSFDEENKYAQNGVGIERHGCGLEIRAGKVVDRYHRIYIKNSRVQDYIFEIFKKSKWLPGDHMGPATQIFPVTILKPAELSPIRTGWCAFNRRAFYSPVFRPFNPLIQPQ